LVERQRRQGLISDSWQSLLGACLLPCYNTGDEELGGRRESMYRILICEDDPKLAALLREHMDKYGYESAQVEDFDRVMEVFRSYDPHLVLLDVNLPKYDGFYWCRQIRTASTCPILFISARAGEMDQVLALEYGADDYMTKPFHSEVVLAKIKSQLRRVYGEYAGGMEERVIEQSGLSLYPERLELRWSGRSVTVSKKESELIEVLMKRYPLVASRETLLEKLWDEHAFVDENTLNVNINRARKKLQELGIEDGIETVRGAGYRLVLAPDGGELAP
jgi:two-component system, OmpR family, response regulator YxdJ